MSKPASDRQSIERARRFAVTNIGHEQDRKISQNKPVVTITISPKKVTRVLAMIVGCLVACYVVTQLFKLYTGHDHALGLVHQFNLDVENNIPTWYSSTALLLCALLLVAIGLGKKEAKDRYASHWLSLGGIFGFLSLDESASIHEMTGPVVRSVFEGSNYLGGYLWFSWVIAGGVFVFVVGAAYLRFLMHLPFRTRRFFLLAGALYVGGALGLELVEGKYWSLGKGMEFEYAMITGIEEALEMSAIVIFIYGLLLYLDRYFSGAQLRTTEEDGHGWTGIARKGSFASRSQSAA